MIFAGEGKEERRENDAWTNGGKKYILVYRK